MLKPVLEVVEVPQDQGMRGHYSSSVLMPGQLPLQLQDRMTTAASRHMLGLEGPGRLYRLLLDAELFE